jgi:type II secretory pathway pseudopilin PulG
MARRMPTGSARQRGVAYLLLLLGVALIGLTTAAVLTAGATLGRRNAETELLAVGMAYQQALRAYAGTVAREPGQVSGRGPRELAQLLKDPRFPGVVRHLRSVYADPLTGGADWRLVVDSEGFIIGLYSTAPGTPIKQRGFDERLVGFEDAETYGRWVFGLPGAAERVWGPRTPRPSQPGHS